MSETLGRFVSRSVLRSLAPWVGAGALIALAVAALDPVRPGLPPIYLALMVPGALALWAAWRWAAADAAPNWLPLAMAAAVLLRLGFGLLLARALPSHGYPDSEPHQAGYYYLDAMVRDEEAWSLADSGSPLTAAFSERSRSDQYGGMLYLSASLYRDLSPQDHRPILPVTAGALVAGLGVLFAWAFASQRFGPFAGSLAAWAMALYPESVLLGATQMREPYLISGFAAVLFAYGLLRQNRTRAAIAVLAVALTISATISPPYALVFATVAVTAWLWEGGGRGTRFAILAAAIGFLGLGLTAGAWAQLDKSPQGLAGLLDWWIVSGAEFELYQLERGSGFVQKMFELTPEWAHLPMATGNGLVQPFLPATLLDSTSLPLPRALGVLRGLGWFALLPFLVYAPFAAYRRTGLRSLQAYLSALVWLTAIGASFRLAGDQWDNPRSRTVFLAAQLALAGWAWAHARQSGSPWLARSAIMVGGPTVIFLQWYAGRYYQTPRFNLNETTTLVVAFVVLFLVGALLWDRRDRWRKARLTPTPPEV